MANVNTRQRVTRRHRPAPSAGRWPELAPLYGVQYRSSGHAITFTEDERAAAVQFVAEAPGDRRLVVARWTGVGR